MDLKKYTINEQVNIVYKHAKQKYSELGGYEYVGIFNNGDLVCSNCMEERLHAIIDSIEMDIYDNWRIIEIITEAELEYIGCSHCGKQLGYWD